MRQFTVLAFILGIVLAPAAVHAQANTPVIDHRQNRQDHRIDQGIANDQINPYEARRLERGQARINRLEDRTKADGQVSRRERVVVRRALNRESRGIARARHNNR